MNRWLIWAPLAMAAAATLAAAVWASAPPAIQAGGPTNVSGTISANTTWTLADSPYIVTGNVFVFQGVTLTIEPGVTVKFDTTEALQVEGTLMARGTITNPITFTSSAAAPAKGDWVSIIFTDTSPDATFDGSGNYTGGSILEYCVVEYAGGGAGRYAAIRAVSSAPFINNCTIRNNQYGAISASYADDSIFRITNNVITSSGGGVSVDIRAIISNNMISHTQGPGITASRNATITNNGVSNNAGTGISFSPGSAGQTAHIGKNVVRANGRGGQRDSGILAEGSGAVTISENIVLDNVGFIGAGVLILWGTVTVTNNLIVGNSAHTGGGISVGDWGIVSIPSPPRIFNNSIVANTAATDGSGIILYSAGTVQANTLARNGRSRSAIYAGAGPAGAGTTISNNNLLDSTAAYEIQNKDPSTQPPLNATNNWWGTTSEAAIQSRILDHSDDIALGLVNYSPYLTSPNTAAPISPPTGLVLTPGAGTIPLSWGANPEGDTAGYKVYYDTDSGYPYTGTGALQGSSPIDVGNVTTYTLTGLPPGTFYVATTAYDTSRDGTNDQTDGNESWFSEEVTGTLKIYLPLVARGFVGGW